MRDKKIIRQELIDKFKGNELIHRNTLLSGELRMLDLCLESLPDEPMYPEKFVEWSINHKDLLIKFGIISKLFTYWKKLPENKQ